MTSQTMVQTKDTNTKMLELVKFGAMAFGLSWIIAISAQIMVPAWPVPFTMQTLVIIVMGMLLPARLGIAAVALYFAQVACGLPFMTGFKGGVLALSGPTIGYALGFFPEILVISKVKSMLGKPNVIKDIVSGFAGQVSQYSCGVLVLSTMIGFEKAIVLGLLPFLASAALKLAVAVSLSAAVRRLRHG